MSRNRPASFAGDAEPPYFPGTKALRMPDESQPAAVPVHYDDEISVWEILSVLVRRRGTIVLTTIAVVVLALAYTFLKTDSFTTTAAFRPQGGDTPPSQLMALASQFGVNVPTGASDEASPDFYAELLTSRQILATLADWTYDVDGVGRTSLADLLEIERDTEPLRRESVITWLEEDAVTVEVAVSTGTVSVSVETEWPDLSLSLAERLLAEVTRFNLHTRQSTAEAERVFIEARVDSARYELRTAEDDLREWLEANRQWQGAPLLEFEQDQLQREVTLKSSILQTLSQSYEQARIAERRDTPVITVLQPPFLPPGPDESSLIIVLAVGLVLGGMSGVVLAIVIDAVQRPAEGDPARRDFQESLDAFLGSLPFIGRSTS